MGSGKACPSLCTPFYTLLGGEKPTAGRPCSSALCQRAASGRDAGRDRRVADAFPAAIGMGEGVVSGE